MTKTEMRRLAANILPTSYLDPKEYLAAVYQVLKQNIAEYSYIRFSEDMGFGSCNAMHLIIHGQRPLTLKGAVKISEALGLTGVDRRYFMGLVEAQRAKNSHAQDEALERVVELKSRALPTQLDRHQLEFFNDWHHAAILELLSLPDASSDPEWISQSLQPSISPLKVKNSLKLLKRLGHIVYDKENKRWLPSQQTLSTGNEVLGMAVIRYHQQMIDLARRSLLEIGPYDRDISAVTISFPMGKIEELKQRVQAFRRELLELSKDVSDADTILQVNIQVFPVARRFSRRKRHAN